jgi:uncharacterized membrane protein
MARGLGWFSVGLGVTALVAPRGLTRLIGLGDHRFLLRVIGLRELISGAGILGQSRSAGWVASRVAGDVMDLAALALALGTNGRRRGRVVAATAAVAGVTALDALCTSWLRQDAHPVSPAAPGAIHVKGSITVNRPPADVYRFWRDLGNLPGFMRHLESVEVTGPGRSHWTARGPAGLAVEWDAETVEDIENRRIAWRSLEGAGVANAGSVQFVPAPGDRGTEVSVELSCRPPAGRLGAAIARLLGEAPEQQVLEDLRRLKRLVETGELPSTEGQPSGRRRGHGAGRLARTGPVHGDGGRPRPVEVAR